MRTQTENLPQFRRERPFAGNMIELICAKVRQLHPQAEPFLAVRKRQLGQLASGDILEHGDAANRATGASLTFVAGTPAHVYPPDLAVRSDNAMFGREIARPLGVLRCLYFRKQIGSAHSDLQSLMRISYDVFCFKT